MHNGAILDEGYFAVGIGILGLVMHIVRWRRSFIMPDVAEGCGQDGAYGCSLKAQSCIVLANRKLIR
jgi:hypothetical protein